jgi:hypothetical protein
MDAQGAKELADRSGNGFQCRVLSDFRQSGWETLLSPHYVDLTTAKTREADMITELKFPVRHAFAGQPVTSIHLRLFIECKYVPAEKGGVVFWVGQRDRVKTENWVRENAQPFRSDHPASWRLHHYLRDDEPVAKLFTSEQDKRDEDPFFRSLNQCLNNYVYNAGRETRLPTRPGEQVTVLAYPLIVCSTFQHFFSTNIERPADPTPLDRAVFQVELDYAYTQANGAKARGYFLVDVVDFSRLGEYLQHLIDEVNAATPLLAIT